MSNLLCNLWGLQLTSNMLIMLVILAIDILSKCHRGGTWNITPGDEGKVASRVSSGSRYSQTTRAFRPGIGYYAGRGGFSGACSEAGSS